MKDFMIRRLTVTDNDAAVTFLRLVLGVVFFAHGAQKALGWFGGYGFSGTMGFFTGMMHIPALLAVMAIASGIPRRIGSHRRTADSCCGLWDLLQHGCCRCDDSSSIRLFYELGGDAEGRRFRVPPPGTGDYRLSDDSRCRRSFRGSPVVFPRREKHPGQGTAPSGLI
jgi:hypothetical protein